MGIIWFWSEDYLDTKQDTRHPPDYFYSCGLNTILCPNKSFNTYKRLEKVVSSLNYSPIVRVS